VARDNEYGEIEYGGLPVMQYSFSPARHAAGIYASGDGAARSLTEVSDSRPAMSASVAAAVWSAAVSRADGSVPKAPSSISTA
jgi:hypothetical protein